MRHPPPSSLALQFTQTDEGPLLAAYRNTASLPDRTGYIWVLAHVGGDETAKAFIATLSSEFANKRLSADEAPASNNEEPVMQSLAWSMGLLAQRSRVADDFLHLSTEPAFWQGVVKWTSSTGKEVYGLLASSAIQGLGLAGRPEDLGRLERFKTSLPRDVPLPAELRRTFEGDIVQAAFYADMLRQKGSEGLYRWLLDVPSDEYDADGSYGRWEQSTNGAAWNAWYKAQKER
jgi:hypothetical protein